ncbi:hypothetical protein [Fimbriimonas ginsengisoli]|nr:hypothetical protein [Fimbriimonas ginsengisoli]
MTWRQLLLTLQGEAETLPASPVRIAPLIMSQDPETLIERRGRAYTRLQSEKMSAEVWRVQTLKEIPGTVARESRHVESTFLLVQAGDGEVELISRADRDTYNHGARVLENVSFPLAQHPYLPVRAALDVTVRFMDQFGLPVQVMQHRSSVQMKKRTTLTHGPMLLNELDDSLKLNGAKLEGVRIRAINPLDGEECRLRLDDQCRLLIERWRLAEASPMDLNRLLVKESLASAEAVPILDDSQSEQARFLLFRTASGPAETLVRTLMNKFAQLPGVLVFPLDPGQSEAFKLIDFIAGVDCQIEPFGEGTIAATFNSRVGPSFLYRMRTLLRQISFDSYLVGN